MVLANLRWPALIVSNADRSASFYESVFGWQRWWDNKINMDSRFHPAAIPAIETRANTHLIVMGEGSVELWDEDYNAPSIALTSYPDHDIGDARDHQRSQLGRGDSVLMLLSDNVDEVYDRAMSNGARCSSKPSNWTVPHPDNIGDIGYRSTSFFDPEGTYIEITKKLFSPT